MNLHTTDPEFMERFEYFAQKEIVHEKGQELPEETQEKKFKKRNQKKE